jgi:hypothetical protein
MALKPGGRKALGRHAGTPLQEFSKIVDELEAKEWFGVLVK